MAADNEALARSFFKEADRGRTPVELCTAGFTRISPGLRPWTRRVSTSSKR
jgi:hypothetical protein